MTGARSEPASAAPAPRPPNEVRITWRGGEKFEAGRPDGPTGLIDGDRKVAQGPVDWLLSALAACTAIDVVSILEKRRTPPASLSVHVVGHRVDGVPRRLRHVILRYEIRGAGIERPHAERAVELAVTKYCSVRDSLREDIAVDWEISLGDSEG
jgi:putative redox protein